MYAGDDLVVIPASGAEAQNLLARNGFLDLNQQRDENLPPIIELVSANRLRNL
jgi:hypothetical protein